MNEKNLKPLQTRPIDERKKIASKGGIKSGEVRREKKVQNEIKEIREWIENVKDIKLQIPLSSYLPIPNLSNENKIITASLDNYIYNQLIELAFTKNPILQDTRLKAIRLYWEIQKASDEIGIKKLDIEYKKLLALKEIELKERQIELNEEQLKLKKQIIDKKEKEVIEVLKDVEV